LYSSAGSISSTLPLMPVCADIGFCDSMGMAKTGPRVVFRVEDGERHGSIWSTDGTSGGTVRLTAPSLDVVTQPVPGGGTVAYFWARGGGDLDLWRTDGTTAGTKTIAWGI